MNAFLYALYILLASIAYPFALLGLDTPDSVVALLATVTVFLLGFHLGRRSVT